MDLETSKAKAEALMMEVEDQQTQHMVAEERIMIKKECYLVRTKLSHSRALEFDI